MKISKSKLLVNALVVGFMSTSLMAATRGRGEEADVDVAPIESSKPAEAMKKLEKSEALKTADTIINGLGIVETKAMRAETISRIEKYVKDGDRVDFDVVMKSIREGAASVGTKITASQEAMAKSVFETSASAASKVDQAAVARKENQAGSANGSSGAKTELLDNCVITGNMSGPAVSSSEVAASAGDILSRAQTGVEERQAGEIVKDAQDVFQNPLMASLVVDAPQQANQLSNQVRVLTMRGQKAVAEGLVGSNQMMLDGLEQLQATEDAKTFKDEVDNQLSCARGGVCNGEKQMSFMGKIYKLSGIPKALEAVGLSKAEGAKFPLQCGFQNMLRGVALNTIKASAAAFLVSAGLYASTASAQEFDAYKKDLNQSLDNKDYDLARSK